MLHKIITCCFCLGLAATLSAQCNPDKVPPVLNTVGNIQIALGGPRCVATVAPAGLLQSVSDNCTPEALLKLRVRRAGTGYGFPHGIAGDKLTLSVADLDKPVIAEVWARDSSGNTAVGYAGISVSNPDGCVFKLLPDTLCAATTLSHPLEEVTFQLDGIVPPQPNLSFDLDCMIISDDLLAGDSADYIYRVTPFKDNDPLNGVSTFDGVLTIKHILGEKPFDNPYQRIAADINSDGFVTLSDILDLRKLILGIYTELPNSTSWRFVPADYAFPNPYSSFISGFPESVLIDQSRTTPLPGFVAIKMGDVNGNAVPNSAVQTDDRSAVLLRIQDTWIPAGQTVSVPVYPEDNLLVSGLQMAWKFDPAQITLLRIAPGALAEFSADNFFQPEPGLLTVSYIPTHPDFDLSGRPLFFLEFEAKEPVQLSQVLSLSPERLRAEVYDGDLHTAHLQLYFIPPTVAASDQIYPAQPNPSTGDIYIPILLAEPGAFTTEVHDLNGRSLYIISGFLEAGFHRLHVPGEIFGSNSGIYLYRVTAGGVSKQGRVAVLR